MTSRPRLRKFALAAHVISSVGWLGTVITVLALAIAGATSEDPQTVRAAYLAMELTAWSALVPLALASLTTGIVQSLGTKWGLLRHYWVLAKLVITVLATVVLLLYTRTLDQLAGVAARAALSSEDLALLHTPSVVLHAGVALLLLLVATTLAIYKPPGMTRYGWRKQLERRAAPQA
ncbi:MAG: hypothetical protein H0W96_03415 [Solirubrobacterales bacterium]|nr:hypothetical protein [Solirubrobacterales bacterium]